MLMYNKHLCVQYILTSCFCRAVYLWSFSVIKLKVKLAAAGGGDPTVGTQAVLSRPFVRLWTLVASYQLEGAHAA
jgi:hypothetical protein